MGVTDSRVAGRIKEGLVMTAKMSIAIAAGGTAGHVNPALALADELASRGHDVRFFGETRRLEGKLVPEAGFDFFPVEVTGFDRARPWTLITALAHLSRCLLYTSGLDGRRRKRISVYALAREGDEDRIGLNLARIDNAPFANRSQGH